jgi:benzaldehyde dehydrogenase (NAD)
MEEPTVTLLDESTWRGQIYRGAAGAGDLVHRLDRSRAQGIVHINEQTVDDEANIPFGGVGASGTGARFGGGANADAFTDTRWVTIRGDIAPYPF